jgi:hypothetical protein
MRDFMTLVEARSQAQVGGTIGVNGYFYQERARKPRGL